MCIKKTNKSIRTNNTGQTPDRSRVPESRPVAGYTLADMIVLSKVKAALGLDQMKFAATGLALGIAQRFVTERASGGR